MDGKTLILLAITAGLTWWLASTWTRRQYEVPMPRVPLPGLTDPADPGLRVEVPPDPGRGIWT